MPTSVDISIWRGNNSPPIVWSLSEAVPMSGSAFSLTILADGLPLITKDTASGTLEIDLPRRELRWAYTTAESRLIPLGQIAQYELERHTGGIEVTEIFGLVMGLGGLNSDAGSAGSGELDFSGADSSALQLLGWI